MFSEFLVSAVGWNSSKAISTLHTSVLALTFIQDILTAVLTAVGLVLIFLSNKKMTENTQIRKNWTSYFVHLLTLSLQTAACFANTIFGKRYGYMTDFAALFGSSTQLIICLIIWTQASSKDLRQARFVIEVDSQGNRHIRVNRNNSVLSSPPLSTVQSATSINTDSEIDNLRDLQYTQSMANREACDRILS